MLTLKKYWVKNKTIPVILKDMRRLKTQIMIKQTKYQNLNYNCLIKLVVTREFENEDLYITQLKNH